MLFYFCGFSNLSKSLCFLWTTMSFFVSQMATPQITHEETRPVRSRAGSRPRSSFAAQSGLHFRSSDSPRGASLCYTHILDTDVWTLINADHHPGNKWRGQDCQRAWAPDEKHHGGWPHSALQPPGQAAVMPHFPDPRAGTFSLWCPWGVGMQVITCTTKVRDSNTQDLTARSWHRWP